jgi:16S rRNA (cytidine(1402)-2'-O)-methyltransferase
VLAELADGHAIALISDAGTPLLSDPGFKLVRAVIAAGHPAVALPGASAVLAGLTMSGLPTDSFFFGGFLPARQGARKARLEQLATVPASLVLFESPGRLAEALGDIASIFGEREVVVARELTKHFEEIRRGSAIDLSREIEAEGVKGEIVLVIAPPPPRETSDDDIVEALRREMETSSLRDAARIVADDLGAARSRVYQIGLKLKDEGCSWLRLAIACPSVAVVSDAAGSGSWSRSRCSPRRVTGYWRSATSRPMARSTSSPPAVIASPSSRSSGGRHATTQRQRSHRRKGIASRGPPTTGSPSIRAICNARSVSMPCWSPPAAGRGISRMR